MGIVERKLNDYEGFVNKFKPKLTTDDCYTPPKVYEFIRDKVLERYEIGHEVELVRPFYPGGDFESYHYPEGCLVLDNPPFSCMSKIIDFYLSRGIRFFLFAPALTCLNYTYKDGVTAVSTNQDVIFENGAHISISFLTNLSPELAVEVPGWSRQLGEVGKREGVKTKAKYKLPNHCISINTIGTIAHSSKGFQIPRSEVCFVRALDSQKAVGKSIYGAGLLCSHRVAREAEAARREAEEARTIVWELSDREREIIDRLSHGKD